MMDAVEVKRRIKALYEMPEERRPISMKRFIELCGLDHRQGYRIASGRETVGPKMIKRLSEVLELLEQGRVKVTRVRDNKGRRAWDKAVIEVLPKEDAHPPQEIRHIIAVTPNGVKMAREAVNPAAFPKGAPLFRRGI